jgi:hypothetical protein
LLFLQGFIKTTDRFVELATKSCCALFIAFLWKLTNTASTARARRATAFGATTAAAAAETFTGLPHTADTARHVTAVAAFTCTARISIFERVILAFTTIATVATVGTATRTTATLTGRRWYFAYAATTAIAVTFTRTWVVTAAVTATVRRATARRKRRSGRTTGRT